MGYDGESITLDVKSLPYKIERLTFGVATAQGENVAKPNIMDSGTIRPNSLVMFAKSANTLKSDVWGYTLNTVDFTSDTATATIDKVSIFSFAVNSWTSFKSLKAHSLCFQMWGIVNYS